MVRRTDGMSKKKLFISIIITFYCSLTLFLFASSDSKEALFLELKAKDKINDAFAIASQEIVKVQTLEDAELWIFRFQELLRYPELLDTASESLKKALKENSVYRQPLHAARAKLLLLDIYLRKGHIHKAREISESLGIIREYRLIGPFQSMPLREFENTTEIERNISFSSLYQGKNGKTGWFRALADISGKIDVEDFFTKADESIFYLYTEVNVPHEGNYCFYIGKNCPLVMTVRGEKIFSDIKEHGFEYDQFKISLKLKAGTYPIILKAAGTPLGCSIALRMTDEKGLPVPSLHTPSSDAKDAPSNIAVRLFDEFENIHSKAQNTPLNSFRSGYLLYMAKLTSKERPEALEFFKKAEADPYLFPYASFYSALSSTETAARESFLQSSIEKKTDFVEALAALSDLTIDQNLHYQAFPLIQKIQAINPSSTLLPLLRSNLWFSKSWHLEALKEGDGLLKGPYPSLGHHILGKLHQSNHSYSIAGEHFKKLYLYDRLDRTSLFAAADCFNKAGKFDEAEDILSMGTLFFPNDIELRLKIADTVDKRSGPSAALPFLASAYTLSPFNEKVLFELSETYHRLGKDDLARHYFVKAAEADEKNIQLQRYFSFLYGGADYLHEYQLESYLSEFQAESEKHKSEPAVILLDETVYRLSSDGSKEKRVHLVYKIHSATAIKELSRHAIIINPATENLERILCTVINGSSRVETSETRMQSLSDPESRLYYDAIAHILTVPSLREGSIVDISYSIKTKRADEYGNAFGFINTLGGKFRVLHGNIVIDAPKDRNLYSFFKNSDSFQKKIEIRGERKIYQFSIQDIEPIFEEPYMPHLSEILPMMAITSFHDWEGLYRWYYGLLRGRDTASEAMLSDLRTVINPLDTPLEKVRKIFNFVTSRVRYVGFEFGIGSIRPRSAAETYASGMGDCKDIALVLVALLRAAGLDARLALVRTSDHGEIDISVPWIGFFNHAICYVNLEGGFFLDGTASFSGFREIPDNDYGVKAFVIGDDGYRIIDVRSPLFEPNVIAITNNVHIHEDGSALIVRHFVKKGGMFAPVARYSITNPSGMMKNIAEYWNKAYPGSVITALKIIESVPDKPVEYSYQVNVPSFAQSLDGGMAFKSIMVPSEEFKNLAQLKTRKYSLGIGAPRTIYETTTFNMPKNYEPFSLPEKKKFGNENYHTEIHVTSKPHEHLIGFYYQSTWNQYKINESSYDEFRNLLRFNSSVENEKIIIRKK